MITDLPPAAPIVQAAPAGLADLLARPRTLSVEAHGLRFAYLEWGNPASPLVLCLHGFPDSPASWGQLGPALAKGGYRVVAPWTRGYAPSQAPAGDDYGALTLGQDALAIASALGAQHFVVIGQDWGAVAAYAAAELAPERVSQLVTIAIPHPGSIPPSFVLSAPHFLTFQLPGAAADFARDDVAGIDRLYRRWSPDWKPRPAEVDEVKRAFRPLGATQAILGYYRAFMREAIAEDPGKSFMAKPLAVPTLTLYGLSDGAVAPAAFAATRAYFKGPYHLVPVAGAGHFVQREKPSETNAAVQAFLVGAPVPGEVTP